MVGCQMKYGRIFATVGMAIVLSLLLVVISVSPALAAPAISLSPPSGAVGTTVTVTGTNFSSYVGDSLSIFLNNVEIDDSPVIVPDTGSFSVSFDIPGNAADEVFEVTVKDPFGYTLASSSFTILKAQIRLDVTEGTVGATVTITGQGFHANEVVIFYYHYNGVEALLGSGTVVASPVGEFSYDFIVPTSSGGKHKLTARNDERGNSAEVQFDVIPAATLDPSSGTIGNIVTVTGTGFGYTSEIAVYLKNAKVAFGSSDKYGNIQATFKVPALQPRSYDVKVEDQYGNVDWLEFTITVFASLDKTTGNVGTELIVSGTGFTPGATVTVKYDALEVDTTVADDDGAFSTAFDVPVSTGGTHVVTVSDGTSSVPLSFTMESEAPPVPALLLPETGVEVESRVRFRWQDVDDPSLPITYSLQVASDEDFTSIVLDKKELTDPEYTPTSEEELEPTEEEALYYWRVKAMDSASNESQWSVPESFYVASALALPIWVIYLLAVLGVLVLGRHREPLAVQVGFIAVGHIGGIQFGHSHLGPHALARITGVAALAGRFGKPSRDPPLFVAVLGRIVDLRFLCNCLHLADDRVFAARVLAACQRGEQRDQYGDE